MQGGIESDYPVRVDNGPRGAIPVTHATFSFSSSHGADEFECGLSEPSDPTPTYSSCTSPITYDPLAESHYTFHVKAFSDTIELGEATREFTVDTTAPETTINSSPGALTVQFTFDIEFTASEPGATFECAHVRPGRAPPDRSRCDVAAGRPCDARATARTGFDDRRDRPRRQRRPERLAGRSPIDTGRARRRSSRPPSGAATFVVRPRPSRTPTFECRLEGPAGDSGFQTCASPRAYPDLAPGDYHFTLRTLDAAGNHADANPHAFSIAPTATPVATVSPTPTPTRTPTATPTPVPTPEIGETVVVRPISGKILARVPGSDQFVALDATKGLPVGTEIDAKNGKIQLTSEPGQGKPVQKATFYGTSSPSPRTPTASSSFELSERSRHAPRRRRPAPPPPARGRAAPGDGEGQVPHPPAPQVTATIRAKWLIKGSCAAPQAHHHQRRRLGVRHRRDGSCCAARATSASRH